MTNKQIRIYRDAVTDLLGVIDMAKGEYGARWYDVALRTLSDLTDYLQEQEDKNNRAERDYPGRVDCG